MRHTPRPLPPVSHLWFILALVASSNDKCPAQTSRPSAGPTATPTSLPAPTTASSDNLEVDAYIKSLHPPSVDEIIKSLEPIPTIEELQISLQDNSPRKDTAKRDKNDEAEAERLEKEIWKLRKLGEYASASRLAKQAERLRLGVQGESHWQVIDARHLVDTLMAIEGLPGKEREAIASADRESEKVQQLYSSARYQDALQLAVQVARTRLRVQGPKRGDTASIIGWIATLKIALGDIDGAALLLREAYAVQRDAYGPDHPIVFRTLTALAEALKSRGNAKQVFALRRAALAANIKNHGTNSPEVATNLNNLAGSLADQGDYSRAEPLYREVLSVRRSILGANHPDTLISVRNLGWILQARGRLDDAKQLLEEALRGLRDLYHGPHPLVAVALNDLGEVNRAKGDYKSAEPYYHEALTIRRLVFGDSHPRVGDSMNNLANLFSLAGEFDQSELMYRQALKVYSKAYGRDHRDVAGVLNNLGGLLQSRGEFAEAERVLRDGLAIRAKLFGENDARVAESLASLGLLLQIVGKYEDAEIMTKRALEIRRHLFGENDQLVATSINNLGAIFKARGERKEAIAAFDKSLKIRRSVLGRVHYYVAMSLYNLANSKYSNGDYEEACEDLNEAADIFNATRTRVRLLGYSSGGQSTWASVMALFACLLTRNSDSRAAAARYEEGLARVLFDDVQMRSAIAENESDQSRQDELMREILKADEKLGAMTSTSGAGASNSQEMARLRRDKDELIAETLRFQDRLEQKYGVAAGQVYDLARIQATLRADAGLVFWVDIKGDPHAVDPNGEHWACVVKKSGEPAWAKLPGSGDNGAWTNEDDDLPAFVAQLLQREVSVQLPPALATPDLSEALQTRTGVTLRHRLLRTRRHLSASDYEALANASESSLWKETLDILSTRSGGLANPSKQSELFKLLARQRIEPIEKHLAGINHLIVLPAGWMAAMPIEALTDKYVISYAPSGTMYAWLAEKRVAATTQPSYQRDRFSLLALGDPVFAKPDQAPPTSAPAPPDHGVLFAMVAPDSNAEHCGIRAGDVLLTYGSQELNGPADLGPAIQKVTEQSTNKRNKALPEQPCERSATEMTASAGTIPVKIWRDGQTLTLGVALGKLGVQPSQQPAGEAIRAKRELDDVLNRTRGESFVRLPGSRREVTTVSKLFQEKPGAQAMTLLGSDASEQQLDRMVVSGELKSFRHLLFSTHAVMDDQVAMRSALILSQDNLPDPYQQVLANKEVYDGKVTAEQVVRTWKLDADLVTLSACQTALGKQAGGEGFLGFSQALFVAGARSLLLSLWKVDDTATMLLMTRFYENLLGQFTAARTVLGHSYPAGKAMSKATALAEAKKWLRGLPNNEARQYVADLSKATRGDIVEMSPPVEIPQGSHPYEHPYYWAAFVLIGDPQ